jgi:hypothetical protein
LPRKQCKRVPGDRELVVGADHLDWPPPIQDLQSAATNRVVSGIDPGVIEWCLRHGDYVVGRNVAECIELVLSDNDLGADINPAIQVDHVVVDKTEAAG